MLSSAQRTTLPSRSTDRKSLLVAQAVANGAGVGSSSRIIQTIANAAIKPGAPARKNA